jgi:hypothetical protein
MSTTRRVRRRRRRWRQQVRHALVDQPRFLAAGDHVDAEAEHRARAQQEIVAVARLAQGLAQDVTGAGASFPAPLYAKWAADYNKATGVKHQLPVGRLRRRHQADRCQDGRLRRLRHAR